MGLAGLVFETAVEFAQQIQQLFLLAGRELPDLLCNDLTVRGQDGLNQLLAFGCEMKHVGATVLRVGASFHKTLFHETIHETADVAFGDEQAVGEDLLGNAFFAIQLRQNIELGQGEIMLCEMRDFTLLDLMVDAHHVKPREDAGLSGCHSILLCFSYASLIVQA